MAGQLPRPRRRLGRIAASLKAQVSLVERGRLGGTTMHEGGVLARALARSAAFARAARQAGVDRAADALDFAEVMSRVQRQASSARKGVSVAELERLGVENRKQRVRPEAFDACRSVADRELADVEALAEVNGIGPAIATSIQRVMHQDASDNAGSGP